MRDVFPFTLNPQRAISESCPQVANNTWGPSAPFVDRLPLPVDRFVARQAPFSLGRPWTAFVDRPRSLARRRSPTIAHVYIITVTCILPVQRVDHEATREAPQSVPRLEPVSLTLLRCVLRLRVNDYRTGPRRCRLYHGREQLNHADLIVVNFFSRTYVQKKHLYFIFRYHQFPLPFIFFWPT